MNHGYEEAYYKEYDIGAKSVDYLQSPELRGFHAGVARDVVAYFQPKTMLDAGCAMGVLVSEFRKLGVDAYGMDYSDYAVNNADPIARPYCHQGSLADPFPAELPRRFDLVTCMEVLEHMSPEDSRKAVANLCSVTDTVIFCSTPDDFEDPTHINVQEREYWAALFAENGFFDDLNNRPLFMTSYAVCYRKRDDWKKQIPVYERFVREADVKMRDFHDEHYRALEKEMDKAVSEWTRTANDFRNLQQHCAHLDGLCKAKEEQLLDAANQRIALQEQVIQAKDRIMAAAAAQQELEHQLQKAQEICDALEAEMAKRNEELESAALLNAKYEKQLEEKEDLIAKCESQMAIQENQIAAYAQQLAAHAQHIADLNGLVAFYQGKIADYQRSTSWKLTAPFRFVSRNTRRLIGRIARKMYRLAKRILRRNSKPKALPAAAPRGVWPPKIHSAVSGSAETVKLNCNRLGIYTIFDKDGIVDDYILYFLEKLSAWTSRMVVVCNGSISQEGAEKLKALGCEVLCRENSGFDAWGVKAGIDHVGFAELEKYDEVIISNNTLFGPVSDMKPMFESMSGQKVDFWGITSHPGFPDFDPFNCNPYGHVPEHIQSFFYGIRGRMLKSDAFRRFWTQLPALPDYNAAVGLYETVMTRYFTDAGFRWNCYMKREDYYDMTDNPLIAMPMEAIRDWNCPFFKRRAFFQDYDYITTFTGQQSASCLMQYLQENTDYPLAMVWQNLIRTCHMSDLVRNLHLACAFDRENIFALNGEPELKAALFMHIYDATMAPELAGYACAMPESADIYISTVSEEKKTAIAAAFGHLKNRIEIRVLPNRGRDVSALLASFKDVVMNYDVACVTHDKKTGYLKPQTVGEGFAYMGYENILGSKTFVQQVIQSFAEDEYLGLLYAPDPNHADFATHIGLEWGTNYECTKQLADTLGLHVPMDDQHPPMAPFGSSFWFRVKAMEPLFAKNWTYEDYPAEPFDMKDGSVLHAIERIYPFVAQHAGYYSAMVATTDYMAVDIGNLFYYAQRYVHACFDNGIMNRFITTRDLCNIQLNQSMPVADAAAPMVPASPRSLKRFARRVLNKMHRVLSRWANE